jgi:hypothetical protein
MFAFQILKKEVEMSPSNIKSRKVATNTIAIECPTCGEDTTLSKDCVLDKELKTNENLADLCDKLRHLGVVCESCNEKQANTKCLNCDVAFCEACFEENHTTVILKRHKRVHISQDDPVKFCETHRDQKLKLFCVTCQYLICLECTYQTANGGHKGHDCITLEDYVEACRREVLRADVSLVESQKSVGTRVQRVDKRIAELEEELFTLRLKANSLRVVETQITEVRDLISATLQSGSSMKMADTSKIATKLMLDLGYEIVGVDDSEQSQIEILAEENAPTNRPAIKIGRFRDGEKSKRYKIIQS